MSESIAVDTPVAPAPHAGLIGFDPAETQFQNTDGSPYVPTGDDITGANAAPLPMDEDERAEAAERITRDTFILRLKFYGLSFRRQTSAAAILKKGAKPEQFTVTKRLLDRRAKALRDICVLKSQFKEFVRARHIPMGFIKGGNFLLPASKVEEVDTELQSFIEAYRLKAGELADNLDGYKEHAREALGEEYRESDYPAADEVRRAFFVEYSYMPFNAPAALKSLNMELYRREAERFRAKVESASEEARNAIRAELLDLTEHAVERLTPGEDGRRQIFRDSFVTNINQFLDNFEARNMTNDAELSSLVARAREVMSGVDPAALRKDDAIRAAVATAFKGMKEQMSKMVVAKPTRSFDFGDINAAESDTADEM